MFAKCSPVLVLVCLGWMLRSACGQGVGAAGSWRDAGSRPDPVASADRNAPPMAALPRRPIAHYTEGNATLPNTHGQIWREYDISPYTLRVTTTNRPEQAIVDWVLRETGYEAWHGEPLGILSATHRSLRVYHTPAIQAVVADIVDRFVNTEAESRVFGVRLVTLDQPGWRSRAQNLMRPVPTQTPGVQAWLMEKEDSALLLADLHRRIDYREHSSPHLVVNNGQSSVISALRGRSYIRDIAIRPEVWPGYQALPAQIDEGFSLELTPLLSLDGRAIDATIKCDIDQVEKLIPVTLDVATAYGPRQRAQIESPQITRCRFHERFRWPADKVLLINLGMVPMPIPTDGKTLIAGLPLSLGGPPRADLLVFVESKGELGQAAGAIRSAQHDARTYHGRY